MHLTAVASRSWGLSSAMMRDACRETEVDEPAKPLTGTTAPELSLYAFPDDVSKASHGLTAISYHIDIKAELT